MNSIPPATAGLPQPRRIPFEFAEELPAMWKPEYPEWCALINALSLTMPYLEPFLIRAVREAAQTIPDAHVQEQAAAFITQEGQHFRAHRRFNDLLKKHHYPQIEQLEQELSASYLRIEKSSLRVRMAYTFGFESLTVGLTHWLVSQRVRLFGGVDSQIVSFVLWHMVEEIEHRSVALSVYRGRFGSNVGSWLARVAGIIHASVHIGRFAIRSAASMLRTEGRWPHASSVLKLSYWTSRMLVAVIPEAMRAALPGHDPQKISEPAWVQKWLDGYRRQPHFLPMVDTHHPSMPPPFPD